MASNARPLEASPRQGSAWRLPCDIEHAGYKIVRLSAGPHKVESSRRAAASAYSQQSLAQQDFQDWRLLSRDRAGQRTQVGDREQVGDVRRIVADQGCHKALVWTMAPDLRGSIERLVPEWPRVAVTVRRLLQPGVESRAFGRSAGPWGYSYSSATASLLDEMEPRSSGNQKKALPRRKSPGLTSPAVSRGHVCTRTCCRWDGVRSHRGLPPLMASGVTDLVAALGAQSPGSAGVGSGLYTLNEADHAQSCSPR
jgi:hypothetical protein